MTENMKRIVLEKVAALEAQEKNPHGYLRDLWIEIQLEKENYNLKEK